MPEGPKRRPAAVDITVEAGAWPAKAALAALVRRARKATAAAVPETGAGDLSVVFTDDGEIAALNRAWRGQNKPTNVLSFPAASGQRGPHRALGDIVIGYGTVAKEAAEAGLTLEDHLTHLLVHGLLHLVGHDHVDDAEATAMEALETAILAALGIADPYAGSDPEIIVRPAM